MAAKLYPNDVLEQVKEVLGGWNKIDPALKIGSVERAPLEAEYAQAAELQARMTELEAELTDKRNQRDDLYTEMWDKAKRVRAGIKALFGDDSSQYEMVGGTRRTERKGVSRQQPAQPDAS